MSQSGRLESNQRSPVPKTGGVAISPTARQCLSQSGIRSRGSRTRKPLKAPASRSLPQPLTGNWFPGRGPGGVREVDDRGIEPRSTAVSERRLPSRPVVDDRCARGGRAIGRVAVDLRCERLQLFRARSRRRQGIAPCSTGSQPAGSLQALRRSLAGRIRTPIARGRSAALIH